MTHGAVRVWLRIEGLAALVLALWFYARDPNGWALFAWLFLVPDLSLAAYLAGPRAGAIAYNLVHSYSLPLGLLLLGTPVASPVVPLALIWLAHISFDRCLGFGLQYPTGAGETHLGRIGGRRPIGHPWNSSQVLGPSDRDGAAALVQADRKGTYDPAHDLLSSADGVRLHSLEVSMNVLNRRWLFPVDVGLLGPSWRSSWCRTVATTATRLLVSGDRESEVRYLAEHVGIHDALRAAVPGGELSDY